VEANDLEPAAEAKQSASKTGEREKTVGNSQDKMHQKLKITK